MTRTIIIALVMAATIAPASADWRDRAFNGHAYRTDDGCRRCGRHHRRWRDRRPVQQEATCKPAEAVTGDQGQDEKAAKAHAVSSWRGRVRWLYGERYSDENRALDPRWACGPSSVPDATRDKALPQLYRCELVARPCRQELQRLAR